MEISKSNGLIIQEVKESRRSQHFFNPHTIYFFHRPVQVNNKTGKIHALPTLIHHNDYQRGVRPDFNLNDNKAYEDFQIHVICLNSAMQLFPIPFIPNWLYYLIDYQMSLDEDLQFCTDKRANPPVVQDIPKEEKHDFQSQECPPEYFQDAQLPDDLMNIDEVGRMFNIEINDDPQQPHEEPEEEYICPDDHYGCCDKHIIDFEIDH
ncbi:hypothetical protein DY000_02049236 [Brassica cretica]|uniref:DUF4216 domain-containing protein n=1 Tax=Brassica cretica TaxID=69181 RepID=A0ABQ7F771_BRACR|nr:hypothetical protein DY000_02049236 [Brassica cretica]